MAKKNVTEKKYVTVYSPVGTLSYPSLVKPDTGRTESSLKFSGEIFVPKAIFTSEGKDMVASVLAVAREHFKKPKLKLADIQNPFKDMDSVDDAQDWQKGTIRIRAKAGTKTMTEAEWGKYRPTVIGPRKVNDKFPVWPLDKVAEIKGGDKVRFICSVYAYDQQGGGVALGLNFVQFAEVGEPIGQGKMKAIEELAELEVAVDAPEDLIDTDSADEDTEKGDPEMSFG